MLVYSTTLWLQAPPPKVLSVVADWLSAQIRMKISVNELEKKTNNIRNGTKQILIKNWFDSTLQLYSISYKHPDRDTQGRYWITEIGIRRSETDSETECSVRLETSESSVRAANADVEVTRPLVVHRLLENCKPTSRTPGHKFIELDDNNVEALKSRIEDRNRHHPIVMISPHVHRGYLSDPINIYFQLAGISDVIAVRPEADTQKLTEILGRNHSVWHGAARIIYPSTFGDRPTYTHSVLFDQDSIEFNSRFEKTLLEVITHRMNWSNSRWHISPETVEQAERVARLSRLAELLQTSDEYRELISLYEQEYDGLTTKNNQLSQDYEQLEDEKAKLEYEILALKHALQQRDALTNQFELSNTLQTTLLELD